MLHRVRYPSGVARIFATTGLDGRPIDGPLTRAEATAIAGARGVAVVPADSDDSDHWQDGYGLYLEDFAGSKAEIRARVHAARDRVLAGMADARLVDRPRGTALDGAGRRGHAGPRTAPALRPGDRTVSRLDLAPRADTLAGVALPGVTFHYDLDLDVLYFTAGGAPRPALAGDEPSPVPGLDVVVRRDEATGEVAGWTVTTWWRVAFPGEERPDSMTELTRRIAALAARVVAGTPVGPPAEPAAEPAVEWQP